MRPGPLCNLVLFIGTRSVLFILGHCRVVKHHSPSFPLFAAVPTGTFRLAPDPSASCEAGPGCTRPSTAGPASVPPASSRTPPCSCLECTSLSAPDEVANKVLREAATSAVYLPSCTTFGALLRPVCALATPGPRTVTSLLPLLQLPLDALRPRPHRVAQPLDLVAVVAARPGVHRR